MDKPLFYKIKKVKKEKISLFKTLLKLVHSTALFFCVLCFGKLLSIVDNSLL